MRREQEAADGHGRRIEAKCGIVENNEGDHHDNDNDDNNEDHVEDDVELIRIFCRTDPVHTRAVFSYFAAVAKKTAMLT